MLTHAEAKKFYDAWGTKQDAQSFYEDPAINELIKFTDFEHVESLFELGCGTGRLAKRLLTEKLSSTAQYQGIDLSLTMTQIAKERLAEFGDRVQVTLSDGSLQFNIPDHSIDCFLATYVLDLLTVEDSTAVLAEAHRVLKKDGKLGLVGLTYGQNVITRLVSWGWARIYAIQPSIVGGCRPIEIKKFLANNQWRIGHQSVITASGISSEVMIAVSQ
jgi:ubiquinone/menaquinone biosynthesis C-methylase UbiE